MAPTSEKKRVKKKCHEGSVMDTRVATYLFSSIFLFIHLFIFSHLFLWNNHDFFNPFFLFLLVIITSIDATNRAKLSLL
jgi:positive regulator of sigma E activity